MDLASILRTNTLLLFIAALGLPIPENPLLVWGGYAIFKETCNPWLGIIFWHLAIFSGDTILYAFSYWIFSRPRVAKWVQNRLGEKRINRVKRAFTAKALQTIFWARMAFGLRATVYVVAGAAHYPWRKFLLADGLSVLAQVLFFVGFGYFSGERIEWALQATDRIVIGLAVVAVLFLALTWFSSTWFKKASGPEKNSESSSPTNEEDESKDEKNSISN